MIRRYSDLAIYRRLLGEARPYWRQIGALFGLSLLGVALTLLMPLPLKIAVDSAVAKKDAPGYLHWVGGGTGLLLAIVAFFVVVALLDQLRQLASTILQTWTGEKLQLRFRARLFRHIQRLSLRYHDTAGTADSVYRIQYDAPSIQWIAVYGITPFVTAALTLVGMLYVTARIDLELAFVALAVTPVLFLLTWASRRRLRSGWDETKQLESSALSIVQEVLTGLRVVKAFGQEEREHERFLRRSDQGMRARVRLALLEGAFTLGIGVTIAVGTAAVLFIGVRHVQAGALTLGSLLLVMGYLVQLYAPLQLMSSTINTLQASFASAERAFAILDREPDVPEHPDPRPLSRAEGAVAFEGVWFAYENEPVLRDVGFAVVPGARVGIAGSTGAGKTTLVSLLMRFYDPTRGRILLDGVDLRDYDVAQLRNQFGIVLQEPVLFSTSIRENIAYARPDAGDEEIAEAARAADAHAFITALPNGYATLVGERGMRLSGGERQRISLARAFLKDAPILILDEPTSSVDVRTEATIIGAMERLMRDRTTFIIAHRLSTLERCDVRLQVEGGLVGVTGFPAGGAVLAEVGSARGDDVSRARRRLDPGSERGS